MACVCSSVSSAALRFACLPLWFLLQHIYAIPRTTATYSNDIGLLWRATNFALGQVVFTLEQLFDIASSFECPEGDTLTGIAKTVCNIAKNIIVVIARVVMLVIQVVSL